MKTAEPLRPASDHSPLKIIADIPAAPPAQRPSYSKVRDAHVTKLAVVYVRQSSPQQVVENRESFWTAVYPLYINREITRRDVRDLVRKGLEEARGSYKIVLRLFNMEPRDYKRFLNFLRKHDCQLPFKEYRQ